VMFTAMVYLRAESQNFTRRSESSSRPAPKPQ
jgi:hypothetical protein